MGILVFLLFLIAAALSSLLLHFPHYRCKGIHHFQTVYIQMTRDDRLTDDRLTDSHCQRKVYRLEMVHVSAVLAYGAKESSRFFLAF